jgi:regulator of protease activity HflC (stomatin/prohibitin superfamily)
MAEIRKFPFCRHVRAEQSVHLLKFKSGKLRGSGRGLAFWFMPMSTSIAEVPIDDRELSFLFHARSADFQDVNVQGVIMYRVSSPEVLSNRIDFSIDLQDGGYRKQPLDQLATMLTELAQQLAIDVLAHGKVREILTAGTEPIRTRIEDGLRADDALTAMGIEIVSVRVSAVKPDADLERSLEVPTREAIRQTADEASFERRALAVEKERAIAENELQNKIELAKREEHLIEQQGANGRRRQTEDAGAKRIEAEAKADRIRIEAESRSGSIRMLDEAKVEGERNRMEIYRTMPARVMAGLAARELAGKLQKIEHLNITPELLGPSLLRLVEAGTSKLEDES